MMALWLKILVATVASIVAVVAMSSDDVAAQGVSLPAPGDSGPYVVTLETMRGPYSLNLWQSPERAVSGAVRFILELRDVSGNSIDAARVTLYGTPAMGGRSKKTPVLNTNLEPHFYYGSLGLEEAGEWDLRFEVEGPEGKVILNSSVLVSERTRSNAFFQESTWLFFGLQAALFGGVLFLWIRSRKRRARMAAEDNADNGGKEA